MSAARCLAAFEGAGIRPWLLLSPVASGDMGYAREGEFIMDPGAARRLAAVRERFGCELGLLLDPSACISRVLNSPFAVWRSVRATLERAGLKVQGSGCSFRGDPRSLLDMVWAYRAAGRLARPDHWHVLSAIPFACREWLSLKDGDDAIFPPRDGVEGMAVTAEPSAEGGFVRALSVRTAAAFVRRLDLSFDALAFTDGRGWSWATREGERTGVPAAEVARSIATLPATARIGVVVDPVDVAWESDAPRSEVTSALRPLPYPYHYFLSLNSDVDWSVHDQVERVAERLCDELGLAIAGSAYPFSRDPRWPSWSELEEASAEPAGDVRLAAWAASNLLDTLHGLAHSFDGVRIVGPTLLASEPLAVALEPPIDLRRLDGLLLATRGAEDPASPWLVLRLDGRREEVGATWRTKVTAEGLRFHVYVLPGLAGSRTPARLAGVEIRPVGSPLEIAFLQTLLASRPAVLRLLARMRENNVQAPVYTAHGGAEGTLELGICASSVWVSAHPAEAALALDRPDSPFYALPEMRAAGVRFFSPLGRAMPSEPAPLDELLVEDTLQDGNRVYTFPRLLPIRYTETGHSPLWTYGKDLANTQSLAANLDALLQRLHWREPGHGGILYTHLGHRVGNQVSGRLGWNEELQGAWERVAEFVHARDGKDPVPFRLWFAPASSVLAFAVIMKGLPDALAREGNDVRIRSWKDETAGCRVPDPACFGTSWLHGVTIHVPDPTMATVSVDGVPVPHFTRNHGDALGGPSVTLVDASWPRSLVPGLPGPGERVLNGLSLAVPSWCEPTTLRPQPATSRTEWVLEVPAVSLRNATHWSFEIKGTVAGADVSLGFSTATGSWFDAGTSAAEPWRMKPAGDGWQRWTFALDDAPGPDRPSGEVVALRVRVSPGADLGGLAFRDVCLLVPRGARALTPTRILAGTARRRGTGEPVSGLRLTCASASGTREVSTGVSGAFVFRGLDDGTRCLLGADAALPVWFRRGSLAHMTCDHWDFDLEVG